MQITGTHLELETEIIVKPSVCSIVDSEEHPCSQRVAAQAGLVHHIQTPNYLATDVGHFLQLSRVAIVKWHVFYFTKYAPDRASPEGAIGIGALFTELLAVEPQTANSRTQVPPWHSTTTTASRAEL